MRSSVALYDLGDVSSSVILLVKFNIRPCQLNLSCMGNCDLTNIYYYNETLIPLIVTFILTPCVY